MINNECAACNTEKNLPGTEDITELFRVAFSDLFNVDNKRFAYGIHKTNLVKKI